MEIEPVKDSRRFDRKKQIYDFVGRHCDSSGRARLFSGRTSDISLRGLGILIDSKDVPGEGDTVDVRIRVFDDEPPLKVVGFVCWRRNEESGERKKARLGIELTGMTDPVYSYRRWLEILTWN
ncbi:MAG: PilZ domain-containing protein [Proteobacteria bacterium]|nr:PilZ domain-containing protein [Pseudomonadota bacterium]MBU1738789.1 PilZ domain-containing protein [Pseudomonadota bacterium]